MECLPFSFHHSTSEQENPQSKEHQGVTKNPEEIYGNVTKTGAMHHNIS